MEEIKFVSHSCVNIKVGEKSILCDPWLFGRAFDDSWCHILPPELDSIDLESVAYIWVSHEHPDHFSIPSLKWLKAKLGDDVVFIYRRQKNKNVVNFVRNLGFSVLEVGEGERVCLDGVGYLTIYNKKDDSALLLETANSTMLNLNDCMLGKKECDKIRKNVKSIDFLLCQFSIAGYSGGWSDDRQLSKSVDFHMRKIKHYFDFFSPRYFVPFASFVTFCTEHNEFLNNYRATVADVAKVIPGQRLQIVFNGDLILGDDDVVSVRNSTNLTRWAEAIDGQVIDVVKRPAVRDDDLLVVAENLAGIFKEWPRFSYPNDMAIELLDKPYGFLFDFGSMTFAKFGSGEVSADARVSSYSLASFVKNEWGADTLNISGEADVLDLGKWRWFLFCRHWLYKPAFNTKLSKYIPRVYAFLKRWL